MPILPLKRPCCLLILLLGLFVEFDSEERLDAGVEIEGFACPAEMLGQELFDDTFRGRMDIGRRLHREQIAELFGPQLAKRPTADHEALIDLLVIATDVYTWKLLRRDRRLPRSTAEARVRQLIAGILTDHNGGA